MSWDKARVVRKLLATAYDMSAQRIDPGNEDEVARWAKRLRTSPAQLREAIAAVGPEIEKVERYLFVALVKRSARNKGGRSGDDR
jgi:hypothetical protein